MASALCRRCLNKHMRSSRIESHQQQQQHRRFYTLSQKKEPIFFCVIFFNA